MLPAHVPDLKVDVVEGDGGDVLADGRDGGFRGGGGWGRGVEGFDGVEEGGFAGVVEAEEEDGVFCGWGRVSVGGLCRICGMWKRWVGSCCGDGEVHTFFGGGPEVDGFG